jgi:hypothetical protein
MFSRHAIGPEAHRVFELAIGLARDGVGGEDAVVRLRWAANSARRLRSVRDFLVASLVEGSISRGSPTYQQALSLVDAALMQGPPPLPSAAAVEEGALERRLKDVPLKEAFDLLCENSPQLSAFHTGLRDGTVEVAGALPPVIDEMLAKRGIPQDQRVTRSGLNCRLLRLAGLRQRLEPIVGPVARGAEPLVRTSAAVTIAMEYLRAVVNSDD